jgi:hypothetical protein
MANLSVFGCASQNVLIKLTETPHVVNMSDALRFSTGSATEASNGGENNPVSSTSNPPSV